MESGYANCWIRYSDSEFQTVGPTEAKARKPNVMRRTNTGEMPPVKRPSVRCPRFTDSPGQNPLGQMSGQTPLPFSDRRRTSCC